MAFRSSRCGFHFLVQAKSERNSWLGYQNNYGRSLQTTAYHITFINLYWNVPISTHLYIVSWVAVTIESAKAKHLLLALSRKSLSALALYTLEREDSLVPLETPRSLKSIFAVLGMEPQGLPHARDTYCTTELHYGPGSGNWQSCECAQSWSSTGPENSSEWWQCWWWQLTATCNTLLFT